MPSGAKKRKAAKKKKEQEVSNKNNNNSKPLGNDDPKSQDERDSDGAESGSPTSRDHQNQPNKPKQEILKAASSSARSIAAENKSMEENARVDVATTKKDGVKNDKTRKKESEGKSSEDSKSQNIQIEHVESGKESDKHSRVVEKETKVDAVDSVSKTISNNGTNNLSKKAQGSETTDSVKAAVAVVKEVVNDVGSDVPKNSQVSGVVESSSKDSQESRSNKGKVVPLPGKNVGESLTVANGNEGKMLPTSDAPIPETNNGAENVRDMKISESSENQPLLASAPPVARRTSWMSCCGLFDVLSGSSR